MLTSNFNILFQDVSFTLYIYSKILKFLRNKQVYHNIDQLLSLYKEMGPFTAPGGASHHHRMAILENTKTTYIYVCATGIAPHCSIAVVVTT